MATPKRKRPSLVEKYKSVFFLDCPKTKNEKMENTYFCEYSPLLCIFHRNFLTWWAFWSPKSPVLILGAHKEGTFQFH